MHFLASKHCLGHFSPRLQETRVTGLGLYNTFKTWLIVRKQQATLSAVTLVVYYTIGLPLGYLLAFRGGWGLRGVYSGLAAAVLVACAYTGVLVTLLGRR